MRCSQLFAEFSHEDGQTFTKRSLIYSGLPCTTSTGTATNNDNYSTILTFLQRRWHYHIIEMHIPMRLLVRTRVCACVRRMAKFLAFSRSKPVVRPSVRLCAPARTCGQAFARRCAPFLGGTFPSASRTHAHAHTREHARAHNIGHEDNDGQQCTYRKRKTAKTRCNIAHIKSSSQ